MDLAKQYQKKTDKQHILDNPDTYIGSVENVENNSWVFEDNKIVNKQIEYIPGLYKLFDEGIVNCRDHVIRMKKQKETNENTNLVSYINISIEDDGTIEMINDGNGIDVAKHPEYDLWIPEMIFGHLRTSTNYNKDEKKIVGGKNGFGFKLVLIWSTYGYIETVDSVRKLKYCQTFENNLDVLGKPSIRKCSTKPYTKIRFKPDYARLGITSLSDSMKSLMIKRVYDIAAITDKTVKVKYNSELVPVKNFVQYVDKYLDDDSSKKIHEDSGEHWEYIVSLAPTNEFTQVSFVNGINTSKGGKHVDYILNQITKKMIAYIEKKKKVVVSANIIKEQLILFVRCNIENPAFDSQTKDYMNTPVSKFGSSCSVSDKFIEKLAKLGIVEKACALSEIKENKQAKKNDGTKSKNIKGIPKLIDANWAGTEKSSMCTIIFCEGDSAKAGIVSGLSSSDRNIIGVYPMKGKLLNVRGETNKKVMDNKEIIEIKKILGLESNKTYTSELIKKNLRYGKILFMTDQDLDGSHIKGLGINLFDSLWSSLSKVDGFMGFMNTPIIKAKKNSQTLLFYNDGEYETWKKNNNTQGWKIKYYKGLGTSTGSEFKEYFQNKKIVYFNHIGESSINAIDKVFNKKRADDRKDWLSSYNRNSYLNTNNDTVSYDEFIDREMIHFSKYDCDRSIPNIMDGLKISLRKILYSAFKKNLTNEIKVAQFSGYVSEHSGYHHGEASLNSAIVGLAQNYVGSNNINLFCPNGQFGTRLQGGKDSASERYIFTQLNQITRDIFVKDDDSILKYLHDDGFPVEPIYYVPIIPMILVNGSKGIGTGFSTEILPYNVKSIIEYLKCKLTDKDVSKVEFNPYFEDFEGSVNKLDDNKYIVKGLYDKVDDNTIIIKELPVGVWTDDYKQYLESLMETTDKNGKKITPYIKQYDDMSKSTNVNIKIKFHKDMLKKIMKNKDSFEKLMKLTTTFSTTNMHLFDANEKLKKYETVNEIIDDYYEKRLELYDVRKKHNIKILENELKVLFNKKKYLEEILTDKLDLRKKKKTEIYELLKTHNFDIIEEDDEYKYLLKMPMDSVNEENVVKCVNDYKNKSKDLENIKKITIENMWLGELDKLLVSYDKYLKLRHSSKKSEK
jgi:DNA topoisomerase II